MPAGFRTVNGDRPEFAAEFGAVEHESREWVPRTVANIAGSDATLCFNRGEYSSGTLLARRTARDRGKPFLIVDPGDLEPPISVAGRIAGQGYRTLNIGGNRSPDPDYGVEQFLTRVFALLVLNGLAIAEPPWPGVEEVLCEMTRVAGPAAAAAALRGDYKARSR